jgi:hypothetical protein
MLEKNLSIGSSPSLIFNFSMRTSNEVTKWVDSLLCCELSLPSKSNSEAR